MQFLGVWTILDYFFLAMLWKTCWRNCLEQKGSTSLVLFTLRQLIEVFLVVFMLIIDFFTRLKHILFIFLEKNLIVICFRISSTYVYEVSLAFEFVV